MKQHQLFLRGARSGSRALIHLRRIGHFEFGEDHRAINTGDHQLNRETHDLWDTGDEVRGWARYWNHIYGWIADQLETRAEIRLASKVIRFEDLCSGTETTLLRMFDRCELEAEDVIAEFTPRIQSPNYNRPKFSDDDLAVIAEETVPAATRFGYETGTGSVTSPRKASLQAAVSN